MSHCRFNKKLVNWQEASYRFVSLSVVFCSLRFGLCENKGPQKREMFTWWHRSSQIQFHLICTVLCLKCAPINDNVICKPDRPSRMPPFSPLLCSSHPMNPKCFLLPTMLAWELAYWWDSRCHMLRCGCEGALLPGTAQMWHFCVLLGVKG